VSREAILSAENSGEKTLGARSSVPNPAGELTALPQAPYLAGRWLAAPIQEPPSPALGLRPEFSALRSWRTRTFFLAGRRPVDGQSERDDGCDNENNERDVLQCFPDQQQETLGRPRRYDVRAENLFAMPYVLRRPA